MPRVSNRKMSGRAKEVVVTAACYFPMLAEERGTVDVRSSLVKCEVRVTSQDLTETIFYAEDEQQEAVGTSKGRCR